MREGFISLALTVTLALCGLGCAGRQRPRELVALEKLERDPTLTDTDRAAFNLLAAADALLLRAEIDWDHHDVYATRRDALMGQIKMKTAIAMIQSEHASARIAQLDTDLALANDEYGDLSDRLAVVNEEVALMGRLRAATSAAAEERKALSDQVDAVKKQAVSERQRLVEQVATERQRAAALDGLRGAELAVRTAETLDAATFAKAKYAAASNMLQQAQKEFDAAHWDAVLAGTTLARTEAAQAVELSRPRYEQAASAMNNRGRDRALEGDATAIGGLRTRLERDGDLQRLVLVINGLFAPKQSVFLPDGAKTLDAVRDLLLKYPTYLVQLAGFADEQTTSDNRTALSLARANAVYWALVKAGVEPKRLGIDARSTDPSADDRPPAARAKSALIELSLLYHITP
jgi:outer membrane protein OmpA-like peptidoglycan-associated protein